jgi:hypothetical protein
MLAAPTGCRDTPESCRDGRDKLPTLRGARLFPVRAGQPGPFTGHSRQRATRTGPQAGCGLPKAVLASAWCGCWPRGRHPAPPAPQAQGAAAHFASWSGHSITPGRPDQQQRQLHQHQAQAGCMLASPGGAAGLGAVTQHQQPSKRMVPPLASWPGRVARSRRTGRPNARAGREKARRGAGLGRTVPLSVVGFRGRQSSD